MRTIRELIAAGETYQVNFSVRLRSPFGGDPLGLFGDLVRAQRADHCAFLDMGDRAVCSGSPELFRPQGRRPPDLPSDEGNNRSSPGPGVGRPCSAASGQIRKGLAENTMIVDMVRNDLGRIADPGSVEVSALHSIETLPHTPHNDVDR